MRTTLFLSLLVLASCTSSPEDPDPSGNRLRVAAIFPGSPDRDARWAEGLTALERLRRELGARVSYGEDVPESSVRLNLRAAAESSDVILAADPGYLPAVLEIAPEFPEATFLVLEASRGEGNVVAVPLAGRSLGEAIFEAVRDARR